MSEFPYMPLFPSSYLADTMHLGDPALHGCYLLLLINMWNRPSCSLPDNPDELAILCRTSRTKFKKIWPLIEPFFLKKDGKISQKRLTKERQRAQDRKEKASENARKRWGESAENGDTGDADAYATDDGASICGSDATILNPILKEDPPKPPQGGASHNGSKRVRKRDVVPFTVIGKMLEAEEEERDGE